jgi:hypothetical protein
MVRIPEDREKNELFETLLWLRNHYDVGNPALKEEVLRRVDTTLDKFLPPGFSRQEWQAVIDFAEREGEPDHPVKRS